jgi:hypothetical protein
MLRLPHTAGSPAAQRDLQAIGGWARPTRRSILTGILAVAATPAAAALPTTDTVPAACATPAGSVSPRIAELIANLMRHNAAMSALATEQDADRWTDAADRWSDAMTALVNHRPNSLADYAAKISAIAEVEQPDGCGEYPLRRLAEDITALVGEAR